jgi:hypothetical protein
LLCVLVDSHRCPPFTVYAIHQNRESFLLYSPTGAPLTCRSRASTELYCRAKANGEPDGFGGV